MSEIVVLEHSAGAGASAFEAVLDERAGPAGWRRVHVPDGESLPTDPDRLRGIVVMGGTMSAVDPDAHPWMPDELKLLRRALEEEVPVFGVCLGAQLLAQACGGEVVVRTRPEVGYLPLTRTSAGQRDAIVADWPDDAPALFVHEDEVTTLPAGAVELLTGSDAVPAWRLGSAWAVQFHPEVTPTQLAGWVRRDLLRDLLDRAGTRGEDLVADARRNGPTTVAQGRAMLARFLDGPGRRD